MVICLLFNSSSLIVPSKFTTVDIVLISIIFLKLIFDTVIDKFCISDSVDSASNFGAYYIILLVDVCVFGNVVEA